MAQRNHDAHLSRVLRKERRELEAVTRPWPFTCIKHSKSHGDGLECNVGNYVVYTRKEWNGKRSGVFHGGWYDGGFGNRRPNEIKWWGVPHHDKEITRYNARDYDEYIGFTGHSHKESLPDCDNQMCQRLNVYVEIVRQGSARVDSIANRPFSEVTFRSLHTVETNRWKELEETTRDHLRTSLRNGSDCPIHHDSSSIDHCRGPHCWENRWTRRLLQRRGPQDLHMGVLQDTWEMLSEAERSAAKSNRQARGFHLDPDGQRHFASLLVCREPQCQGSKWTVEFLERRSAMEVVRRQDKENRKELVLERPREYELPFGEDFQIPPGPGDGEPNLPGVHATTTG